MIDSPEELSVTLSLDQPDGPTVARWRDEYLATSPTTYRHHVDECLRYLEGRGECWSCGIPVADAGNETLSGVATTLVSCPAHPAEKHDG